MHIYTCIYFYIYKYTLICVFIHTFKPNEKTSNIKPVIKERIFRCGGVWWSGVWCDGVEYGVVGCGVVGCGGVWCNVVWWSRVWCGMVVYDGVWWCVEVCGGVVWCGGCGVIWCRGVWCGVMWWGQQQKTSNIKPFIKEGRFLYITGGRGIKIDVSFR